jgi:hypothetical protein
VFTFFFIWKTEGPKWPLTLPSNTNGVKQKNNRIISYKITNSKRKQLQLQSTKANKSMQIEYRGNENTTLTKTIQSDNLNIFLKQLWILT